MPTLELLEISVNNQKELYLSGQTVTGFVKTVLNDDMKLRSLRLQVEGSAYTRWTERRSTGKGTSTLVFWGKQEFLKHDLILWGKRTGDTAETDSSLTQGEHKFSFEFIIPPSSPSSFEGAYGHVRYFLKAVIDRPWKHDHTCKKVFTVIGRRDLNVDPETAIGAFTSGSKSLGFLCCSSGQISSTIKIAKQGFVPGESIVADINVINNGSKAIDSVEMRLVQHTQFTAKQLHKKTRSKSSTVAQSFIDEVLPPGKSGNWKQQEIKIPAISPTLTDCEVIEVAYRLVCEIVPEGLSFNLKTELPIVIGTVPLECDFPKLKAGNATAEGFPWFEGLYPNIPAPSYEECITGKASVRDEEDNDYTRGNKEFVPLYPVYSPAPFTL